MGDLFWCGHKRKLMNMDDDNFESNNKNVNNNNTSHSKENNHVNTNTNTNNQFIYSINNEVYFYTQINNLTSIAFQKKVNDVYASLINNYNNAKDNGFNVKFPPLIIHINSPGGGIFAVFTMIDFLLQLKKNDRKLRIHTIVEGRAASAGTLLSVIADKRYITEYGYMLIHQLSSAAWGKYNELKDDMENCDILMARIKNIYKKHTKIPLEDMDKILSHDLYWDANKCLEMGLVDGII